MDLPLDNKIAIYISTEEAKLFRQFQQHLKLFEVLSGADVFSIKGGSCTIHFDNTGKVGSLDVNRRYKIIP